MGMSVPRRTGVCMGALRGTWMRSRRVLLPIAWSRPGAEFVDVETECKPRDFKWRAQQRRRAGGRRLSGTGERWTCDYQIGDLPTQRWRSRRDRCASCARARMRVLRAHALTLGAARRLAGHSRGVQGGAGKHPCSVFPGRRAGLLPSPARPSSLRSRRPPSDARATGHGRTRGGGRLTLLTLSMSLNSSPPFSKRFVSQANSFLLKLIARIEALATGGWLPCAKR